MFDGDTIIEYQDIGRTVTHFSTGLAGDYFLNILLFQGVSPHNPVNLRLL
jgi:hypothetical protein